ncbi:MAG: DUF3014 domain-containing protein [Myxococcota bacterium]
MAEEPRPPDRSPRSGARPGRRGAGRIVAVIVLLALLAGLVWLVTAGPWRSRMPWATQPDAGLAAEPAPSAPDTFEDAPPEVEEMVDAPTPAVAPDPEPASPPPVALPSLEESDGPAREAADGLSDLPEWQRWLARSDLVTRLVASVDNVAEGVSPRRHLEFLRPRGDFEVLGKDDEVRIDPVSYRRYRVVTEVVASIDAERAALLYRQWLPLLQEAYRELGHPDEDFDARLEEAIWELLRVPVIGAEPALVPRVRRYEFADPEVEGLSPAQKHLVRMGPEGVRRIQSQLRRFAAAAGFDVPAARD